MTNTNYADLCERLRAREGGDWLAWQAADTIKAQAERIEALEAQLKAKDADWRAICGEVYNVGREDG